MRSCSEKGVVQAWRHLCLFVGLQALATIANAAIDPRNANFSTSPWSIQLTGHGPTQTPVTLNGAYNSRTLYNGYFGFGWCTAIETTVSDNWNGGFTLSDCGGGAETTFRRTNGLSIEAAAQNDRILRTVRIINPDWAAENLQALQRDLQFDADLRKEFVQQANLKQLRLFPGEYISENGNWQAIVTPAGISIVPAMRYDSGTQYSRFFDSSYRLRRIEYTAGNYLDVHYSDERITLSNAAGQWILMKNANGQIRTVVHNGRVLASFSYGHGAPASALSESRTPDGSIEFSYDDYYNLIRVSYQDGTYESIAYEQEKDWATSFRDRQGCIHEYEYSDFGDPVYTQLRSRFVHATRVEEAAAQPVHGGNVNATRHTVNCAGAIQSDSAWLFAFDEDERGNRFQASQAVAVSGLEEFERFGPDGRTIQAVSTALPFVSSVNRRAAGAVVVQNPFWSLRAAPEPKCRGDERVAGLMRAAGDSIELYEVDVTLRRVSGDVGDAYSGACIPTTLKWRTATSAGQIDLQWRDTQRVAKVVFNNGREWTIGQRDRPGDPERNASSVWCGKQDLTGSDELSDQSNEESFEKRWMAGNCDTETRILFSVMMSISIAGDLMSASGLENLCNCRTDQQEHWTRHFIRDFLSEN